MDTKPPSDSDLSSGAADCARWLLEALRDAGPDARLPLAPLMLLDNPVGNLMAALADGRLLKLLVRRLRALGDVEGPQEAERDGAATAAAAAGASQLISQFLTACAEFGVPSECLFLPTDLAPGARAAQAQPESVVRCLRALSMTDAAMAAGLRALDTEQVESEYVDMNTLRGDQQGVPGALSQLIGFFRTCRVLARELRESPLTLWPAESVEAVFDPSRRLLELLLELRADLREGKQLDRALEEREGRLLQLYIWQMRHLHITGGPTLKDMDKACLVQVTMALTKLSRDQFGTPDCTARSAYDLQLLPAGHLKLLVADIERELARPRGKGQARDASQCMERSLKILRRVEEQYRAYSERMAKKLHPSCFEFAKLKWQPPHQRPQTPDALGRIRQRGGVQGPEGKQVAAVLWDRALVLSNPGSDEVLEVLSITRDLKFEEVPQKKIAISFSAAGIRKRFSFNVVRDPADQAPTQTPPQTPKTPQPKLLSLTCDSETDRKTWMAALSRAKAASFPEGCDSNGHSFRLTPVVPEDLRDPCRVCNRQFGCWSHLCDRCGVRLHRKCVTAGSAGPNHVGCRPVPKPRTRHLQQQSQLQPEQQLQQQELQQLQQQQQEEPQRSWCEADPIDQAAARVRLRELTQSRGRRRRNFILCPDTERGRPGYQLHVLSGDSVVTYRVVADQGVGGDAGTVAGGGGSQRRVRIAGSQEVFPDLSDLVQHYATNPLPHSELATDDPEIYEVVSEMLVLDSGVADC